jgi:vancomycin resistance protein YoaR
MKKLKNLNNKPLLLTVLASVVIIPLVLLAAYETTYTNSIYPGVSVSGISVGGKPLSTAAQILAKTLVASPSAQFSFIHQDQAINLSLESVEFYYNATASAQKAYQLGRDQPLWQNLRKHFDLIKNPEDLKPEYSLSRNKLLIELHAWVDQPPVPASLTIQDTKVVISPGRDGSVLDENQLSQDLHQLASSRRFDSPISLQKQPVAGTINQEKTEKMIRLLETLIQQPLKLNVLNQNFILGANETLDFLKPISATSSATPSAPGPIFAPIPKTPSIPSSALVEPDKIAEFLQENVVSKINRSPQDAVFRVENGRVTVFRPSLDGYNLNIQKAVEAVSSSLEKLAQESESLPADSTENLLELPVETIPPKIPTSAVNSLGIETLLGKGVSYFRGSIANRIYNIEFASSRLNGILVEPNAVLSLNDILGEVSAETGFKPAYVIKQGRTVLDDGGGVCQVSTTLFRAALSAGLPILERTAHAYRVGYYEQGFDPGIDATVYAPSVDLKFKNDTPAYLLIQTTVDRKAYVITYEIYGTNDGRKSYISKPAVSNAQPPPEPIYQDDPTLPKGEVKQVDWAAWGAKVVFDYQVVRGGETVFEKTFVSNYRPWQAVYLVGTKEE